MPDIPPVRLISHDDLERSRLTVGFRVILAIPHLLWLSLWSTGMVLLSPVLWIATLVRRRPPEGLRDVYVMWIRYAVHVYAYLCLAANPYPGWLGTAGSYPVDLELPASEDVGEQDRWGVAFRLVLAIPPLALAGALGAGWSSNSSVSWGILLVVPFLAWFAILATRRMPAGFEDAVLYALGYTAQTYAYLFLVTPRYPDSHPAAAPVREVPAHPVRLTMADDPRRSRLTVFFRLLLALPHFVWLLLWSIVATIALIITWVAALVIGRPPAPLARFLARFVRYQAHLTSFVLLAGGPFPGFAGAPGSYPIDVEIDLADPMASQSRWRTLFRGLLALPALLAVGALGTAAQLAAVGAWFFALFTARMPLGVRALIAWYVRYAAQVNAYLSLLTDRYPFSGPGPCDRAGAPSPSA